MRNTGVVIGVIVWGIIVLGVAVLLGAAGVHFMRETIAHGDSLVGAGALLAIPLLMVSWVIMAATAAIVPWLRTGHDRVRRVMVVALAAILGFGVYTVNRDVPIQRPDATVTSAVARACTGQAIAEAGIVHTDGAVQNHLVVLDANGSEHGWTGMAPLAWRPPSIGDLEVVACVDAEDIRHVEEVCPYNDGSTTTRYSATRNVRVVAARSGAELARFSITDKPSTCPFKKYGEDREITGSVQWKDLQAHLASLVRDGSFVDPDVAVTREEPEATSEPGSSRQPSEPVAEPRQMTLQAAIAGGLVTARGVGIGLASLDLRLTSKADEALRIVVKAGTYLDPGKRATQTMVVIGSTTIELAAKASASKVVDVACAQMHDDQPGGSDTFTVRTALAKGPLGKLLAGKAFGAAEFRIQQFAVWTITNNPTKSGYVGIGSFGFGSGPSAKELKQIKTIFKDAGIASIAYRALK